MDNKTPLERALEEEYKRREESIGELRSLSQRIIDLAKERNISLDTLKELVLNKLSIEYHVITSLMQCLNEYEEQKISYPLKNNKIPAIIEETIGLINKDGELEKLTTTCIDQYLKLDSNKKETWFFDLEDSYGKWELNSYSMALLTILVKLREVQQFVDLRKFLEDIFDVKKSPLVETVPFPEGFDYNKVKGFNNSFFNYNGDFLILGLGFLFNMGQGINPVYSDKKFAFQDCFSAIQRWCNIPQINIDIRELYKNPFVKQSKIPEGWQFTSYPVVGDIYILDLGDRKHSGLVLNVREEGFDGISYNHNLPEGKVINGRVVKVEGLGQRPYYYSVFNDLNVKCHFAKYIGNNNNEGRII